MKTRTIILVALSVLACIGGVYLLCARWLPRYVEAPAADVTGLTPDANQPLNQQASDQANVPAANKAVGVSAESSEPAKRVLNGFRSAIRFDYSNLPDDADGTLAVQWHGESNGLWFESPLKKRPEVAGKLHASTYYVLIAGATTWRSEPITLAEHEEVTVVLGHGPSQTVTVKVADAETSAPLEGATLMLSCGQSPGNTPANIPGMVSLSDKDGSAVLTGQPVAELKYTVEKFGYEPVDLHSQPIQGGECYLGSIALKRATGTLTLKYDLNGLELHEGETATVSTRLHDSTRRSFKSHGDPQPVSGALDWDNKAESTELAGTRAFGGMVSGRRHSVTVYVVIRDASGKIMRDAQHHVYEVYDTTGTIAVTAEDLRVRER